MHLIPVADLVDRTSVYGVAVRADDVLLVKDRAGGGAWDLPGGGVDDGESLVAALDRELNEETGMTRTSTPQLICHFEEHFYQPNPGTAWRSQRYFFAIDVAGELNEHGNDDDIEAAAFLRVESQRVAAVALAVIRLARVNPSQERR
ncbi:NUDIX domain-containing protein [Mycolicibacterium mengxianglii]|uniref:NUDIX domain-containing protein n=1 Tax=Mycolicibacterium mengxianglii TaxID=2736649 RepID=UPI0022B5F268|nr:NUDIX domain-containing protein [Mycolicibacterium mengxianglii]